MSPKEPDQLPQDKKSLELKECLNRIETLKAELDSFRPLSAEQAESLKTVYDLQQIYHSNAIEGNTLSYEETRAVLEHGVTIANKPLKDHIEAVNHREALSYIETIAQKPTFEINEQDVLKIHQLILHSIDTKWAGKYRDRPVYITRADGSHVTFADQMAVPGLMQGSLKALQKEAKSGTTPLTLAALAHFRLVNIHPFLDGNGRTARLLMNLVLIQNGYPPAVIHVENRDAYIEAIEQARAGHMDDFEHFIATAVEQSLSHTLKIVRNGGFAK